MRLGGVPREVVTPFDTGVFLGNQAALQTSTADAVVSLSRVGTREAEGPNKRERSDRVECWLVEADDPLDHGDLWAALCDDAQVMSALGVSEIDGLLWRVAREG